MTAFGQLQRPLDDSVGCRLNCLGNDAGGLLQSKL